MTDKGKVGVKKAKKLEMKAEKKAMREVAIQFSTPISAEIFKNKTS